MGITLKYRSAGKGIIRSLIQLLRDVTVGFFKGIYEEGVETMTLQYIDMENLFLTLIFGGLVGMPLVPIGVSMELMPLVKDEMKLMEERHFLGSDVLADYFSTLGGEW